MLPPCFHKLNFMKCLLHILINPLHILFRPSQGTLTMRWWERLFWCKIPLNRPGMLVWLHFSFAWVSGHFSPKTFHPGHLTPIQLNPKTFCPTDIQPHGNFTPIWKLALTGAKYNTHGEQLYRKDAAIDKMMRWWRGFWKFQEKAAYMFSHEVVFPKKIVIK